MIEQTFGGRLFDKPERAAWANLVDLENSGLAFVYQRLSTHEQTKKSIYSIKAQDALVDLAKEDGFRDDQIYVENRDLGISGTKGREDRPGLAYLIEQIERGAVEAVYTVHLSRLYRDQTLINAFGLGELFKRHGVIIVTPQMRLNLSDRMHMRLYRIEVERAADELELMTHRLYGAKRLKAKTGHYTGEKLPAGYVVDERKLLEDGRPNPTYHSRLIHEPHADIVRIIFNQLSNPTMNAARLVRHCEQNQIVFSPFPAELDTRPNRKTFVKGRRDAVGNWLVTINRVRSIASNPAYIGWKIWEGQVVDQKCYPAIIEEATFWRVQEIMARRRAERESPKLDQQPLPLAHLVYCGNHIVPQKMGYSNRDAERGDSFYSCTDSQMGRHCVNLSVNILKPIEEAVISQVTLAELAERVKTNLTDEYRQAKEKAASYGREVARLEREVENLRNNLVTAALTAEQLAWIDEQIAGRLIRIRELADLDKQPAGAMGRPTPGQADVEIVDSFLSNLAERWEHGAVPVPNALKNVFLRLLLERVIIDHDSKTITAHIHWRLGLEQTIRIYRWSSGNRPAWTAEELTTLREHYQETPKPELLAMLPNRKWSGILSKANSLKLVRSSDIEKIEAEPYTPEEDDVVRRYYAGEIDQDQAEEETGRDILSIRSRAKKMKLGRRKNRLRWEWVSVGEEEGGALPHSLYH